MTLRLTPTPSARPMIRRNVILEFPTPSPNTATCVPSRRLSAWYRRQTLVLNAFDALLPVPSESTIRFLDFRSMAVAPHWGDHTTQSISCLIFVAALVDY